MKLSVLFLCVVGALLVCGGVSGQRYGYIDVDEDYFLVQGGKGGGGFGIPVVQPIMLQQSAPQKQQQMPVVQPVLMQQPVLQQRVEAAPQRQAKVRYAQPVVTYAQPIVQQADMTPPKVEKQHLTAQAITQPSFQTAPLQRVQAITATAPTIQKGFGSNLSLGSVGLGQNINFAAGSGGSKGQQSFGMGMRI